MEMRAERARSLAEQLLAEELPRRWAHTQGVARRARSLAVQFGDDADLVECAAWLHDVGYGPAIAVTGFHPLDGARYLRDVVAADAILCELVAHHSRATIEAEERGLASQLIDEFGPADRHTGLLDSLTACDMTTSPDGGLVLVENRVAEILRRYRREDLVHRAVTRSRGSLIEASRRVLGAVA